eukprot:gb/GECG01013184.1/.p1 GENE.gb/GECG01013184.1/~~gb/GECG01013184.1/.p1  ORF type:complete len:484 (+),score=69.03 gb/GECG01013184.1/:1-1452(+)
MSWPPSPSSTTISRCLPPRRAISCTMTMRKMLPGRCTEHVEALSTLVSWLRWVCRFEFQPEKETHELKFGEFASEFQKRCKLNGRDAFNDENSRKVTKWDDIHVSESLELDAAVAEEAATWNQRGSLSSAQTSDSSLDERKDEVSSISAAGIEACAPNNPVHRVGKFGKMDTTERKKEAMYLQQKLYADLPTHFANEFSRIDWQSLYQFVGRHGWKTLTSNVLLIGHAGSTTPIHFDEQENLFVQIQGKKQVILASPENYLNLYPFPRHHPADRQSQVDLEDLDFDRFPAVNSVKFWWTELQPSEVLYIPIYWWHYISSITDSVSLNFWFLGKSRQVDLEDPIPDNQSRVTLYRNLEKLAAEVAGARKAAEAFLLLDNRFEREDDILEDEEQDAEDSTKGVAPTRLDVLKTLFQAASHIVSPREALSVLMEVAHRRFRYLTLEPEMDSVTENTTNETPTGNASAQGPARIEPHDSDDDVGCVD